MGGHAGVVWACEDGVAGRPLRPWSGVRGGPEEGGSAARKTKWKMRRKPRGKGGGNTGENKVFIKKIDARTCS